MLGPEVRPVRGSVRLATQKGPQGSLPLTLPPCPQSLAHLGLAHLGGQLQGREAVLVARGLEPPGAAPQQDHVVHAFDEVVLRLEVLGHGHQRVQDVVAPGVLRGDVRLLVLHQQLHNLRLVGAGGQGQGRLALGRGTQGLGSPMDQSRDPHVLGLGLLQTTSAGGRRLKLDRGKDVLTGLPAATLALQPYPQPSSQTGPVDNKSSHSKDRPQGPTSSDIIASSSPHGLPSSHKGLFPFPPTPTGIFLPQCLSP